jgi:hypothetical protein
MFTKIPREMFSNVPRQTWTAIFAGVSIAILVFFVFWIAPSPQKAHAQVPDSGLQRQQMIDELRASNRKLDEIAALLREIRDNKTGDEKKPAPTAKPASTAKPSPTVKPAPTVKSAPTGKPARSQP